MLSLNYLTNPFADVSSIVATKCVILDNLSQTTCQLKTIDFNYYHSLPYFLFLFLCFGHSFFLFLELRVMVSHMTHGRIQKRSEGMMLYNSNNTCWP